VAREWPEVGDEQGSGLGGPQVLVGRTLWWASEEKTKKNEKWLTGGLLRLPGHN
jgi:hypothetical protein